MGHHMILGKTTDYITGQSVIDSHDERIRQRIAKLLVEKKGYEKSDIETKVELKLICGHEEAVAVIDFVINIDEQRAMVIKYGPGSLVSRERPTIAAARLLAPYELPFAVITNGIDAELLDTKTGKVIGSGIESIMSKEDLTVRFKTALFRTITSKRKENETRFLFVYEAIEHSSECDDEFCITRMEEQENIMPCFSQDL